MILSVLNKSLESKFGADWTEYEIETLSFELGALFDDKVLQQLYILKVVKDDLDIMLNDADYFLRFIEVANNELVDAHYHDIPSSLEVLYALVELKRLIGELPVTDMITNVVGYILNNEGHGEAYHAVLATYSGKPFKSR